MSELDEVLERILHRLTSLVEVTRDWVPESTQSEILTLAALLAAVEEMLIAAAKRDLPGLHAAAERAAALAAIEL